MADKVVWFEIPADKLSRAGAFYQNVFCWQSMDMGNGSLAMINGETDEQMVPRELGSINGDISPRGEGFDHPLLVISVENMNAKIKQVETAGGSVVLPPKELAEMSMVWAIIRDTEGNHIGIIQNL